MGGALFIFTQQMVPTFLGNLTVCTHHLQEWHEGCARNHMNFHIQTKKVRQAFLGEFSTDFKRFLRFLTRAWRTEGRRGRQTDGESLLKRCYGAPINIRSANRLMNLFRIIWHEWNIMDIMDMTWHEMTWVAHDGRWLLLQYRGGMDTWCGPNSSVTRGICNKHWSF